MRMSSIAPAILALAGLAIVSFISAASQPLDRPTGTSTMPSTTFPAVAALPAHPQLPELLTLSDGTPVKTRAQWARRRTELTALFAHYVYGQAPPAPGNVIGEMGESRPVLDGKATQQWVTLRFGPERKLSIRLSVVRPAGPAPTGGWPVVLYLYRADRLPDDGLIDNLDLIVARGYALATFGNADCDPDKTDRTDGYHPFYPDYDWGTLACWAWGMQRGVDWLITQDWVAHDRIIVNGHSRRGKAALLAAALDQRIAMAAPSGSGCGGAAISRRLEKAGVDKAESIADITQRYFYWFVPRFAEFAGHEEKLPVDQHELIALVAPRPFVAIEGSGDAWAYPQGTFRSVREASAAWKLLGAGDFGQRVGVHYRPGGHDPGRIDWTALLDFADKTLLGKTVERRFDLPPQP